MPEEKQSFGWKIRRPFGNRQQVLGLAMLPLVVMLSGLLLGGCPEIKITRMAVKPGSWIGNRLTIEGTITVTEDDPPYNDAGELEGGYGLFGLWAPDGTKIVQMRMKMPGESSFAVLASDPRIASALSAPFPPCVPGAFSMYPTICQYFEKGISIYDVEIDIEVPEGTKAITLGLYLAAFSNGSNIELESPTQILVDVEKQSLQISEPNSETTVKFGLAGKHACGSNPSTKDIPYPACAPRPSHGKVQPVEPGPRGCSCDTIGVAAQRFFKQPQDSTFFTD